ncbi:guanine nucleotide-binding protein G(T) subunit gamma-T1 isoform X2 [Mustela erminea]|uniref:guanine nucleotide-binding protein G(T) subunit gamma-T1 isoform X2 n=1 Tax=Mustela erminea TaxID=36723 RepID=UPI0013866719|nr:guanine nucleotide-binding protein G(T) subunit gamma-T1 isoform X2 [Mustela erminea]
MAPAGKENKERDGEREKGTNRQKQQEKQISSLEKKFKMCLLVGARRRETSKMAPSSLFSQTASQQAPRSVSHQSVRQANSPLPHKLWAPLDRRLPHRVLRLGSRCGRDQSFSYLHSTDPSQTGFWDPFSKNDGRPKNLVWLTIHNSKYIGRYLSVSIPSI